MLIVVNQKGKIEIVVSRQMAKNEIPESQANDLHTVPEYLLDIERLSKEFMHWLLSGRISDLEGRIWESLKEFDHFVILYYFVILYLRPIVWFRALLYTQISRQGDPQWKLSHNFRSLYQAN